MKKLIFASGFMFFAAVAFSQYKLDYGVQVGAANYLGEIGGKEKTRRNFIMDMKLSSTRSAVGGFVRYKIHRDILLRGTAGWYRISGADKFSTNPARVGRNLSFRNDIYEITATAQYIFYDIADLGRTYRYSNDFKAYVFTGVGGAYHNPKAEYNGSWVALQPLRTEGQDNETVNRPYSRFLAVIPAGAGFFFTFKKKYRIGWEFNWRTTFSDYLDDVSTFYADPSLLPNDMARDLANRNDELVYSDYEELPPYQNYLAPSKRGDPKHKDAYLSTTINVSMLIKGKSKFGRSRYNSFFGKKYKGRTIRAKF